MYFLVLVLLAAVAFGRQPQHTATVISSVVVSVVSVAGVLGIGIGIGVGVPLSPDCIVAVDGYASIVILAAL